MDVPETEKRIAADGIAYTKSQFRGYFGLADYKQHWEAAPAEDFVAFIEELLRLPNDRLRAKAIEMGVNEEDLDEAIDGGEIASVLTQLVVDLKNPLRRMPLMESQSRVSLCPGGHPLTKVAAPFPGIHCDVCYREIRRGAYVHECMQCKPVWWECTQRCRSAEDKEGAKCARICGEEAQEHKVLPTLLEVAVPQKRFISVACSTADDSPRGVLDSQRASPKVSPEASPGFAPQHEVQQTTNEIGVRKRVAFYGVCDLKYDARRDRGQRLKVLELGSGHASQFSGCGGCIPTTYRSTYTLADKLDCDLLVSNKKLTHDVFVACGYHTFRPIQAEFERVYSPNLHKTIAAKLGLRVRRLNGLKPDRVVLKLVNRCRGAGILVTRAGDELDEVLQELLIPPRRWARKESEFTLANALSSKHNSLAEHCKHWWSNECPIFVAETCETSQPVAANFDGTMRCGFVLRRKSDAKLHVEFLGSYWKLPEKPLDSDDVMARCVSKARMHTAKVDGETYSEVCRELAAVLPSVFDVGSSPTRFITDKYAKNEVLLSFLLSGQAAVRMRAEQQEHLKRSDDGLGISFSNEVRNLLQSRVHNSLNSDEIPCKAALSHVHRQLGVFEAIQGRWEQAAERWRQSLRVFECNASSEHLLGLYCMHRKCFPDAEKHLIRSLQMDPEWKATYVNLSFILLQQEKLEDAQSVARTGLQRYPHTPQCCYNMAIATAKLLQAQSRSHEQQSAIPTPQTRPDAFPVRHLHKEFQECMGYLAEARKPKEAKTLWSPSDETLWESFATIASRLEQGRVLPDIIMELGDLLDTHGKNVYHYRP